MRRPYFPVGFPHKVCFSFSFSTLRNMKKGLIKTSEHLFSFFSHSFLTPLRYMHLFLLSHFFGDCFDSILDVFFATTIFSICLLWSNLKVRKNQKKYHRRQENSHLFFIKLFKWVFNFGCLPVSLCKVHRIFLIGCHPSLFQTKKDLFPDTTKIQTPKINILAALAAVYLPLLT